MQENGIFCCVTPGFTLTGIFHHARLYSASGPNEAYLLRLEKGEKINPSRDAVVMLTLALVSDTDKIGLHDVDELLLSADYAPLMRRDERIATLTLLGGFHN